MGELDDGFEDAWRRIEGWGDAPRLPPGHPTRRKLEKLRESLRSAREMAQEEKMTGYHVADIPRGEFGESSKLLEEVHELIDAEKQGIRVMQLCELADLVGAIGGYLQAHFPDVGMEDLVAMAHATARAFQSGQRK